MFGRNKMKYWKTKENGKVLITKMTNKHLINTLKMLNKNGFGYYHNCFGTDMISDPCMECLIGPSKEFIALESEALKRSLNWKK